MQPPRSTTHGRGFSLDRHSGTSVGMGSLPPLDEYRVRAGDLPPHPPATDYASVTPRAAPPQQRQPQQGGALEWAKGMQARYFASEAEMRTLDGVDAQLKAARAVAAADDAQLKAARARLLAAQGKLAEAKRIREHQAGFTKTFRKKKYEEEMAEADALEKQGEEQSKKFSADVVALRESHGKSSAVVAELERKARRRKALDDTRKKILDNLFSGFHAGDPAENSCEDARNKAKHARDQRKEVLMQSMKALSCVTSAVKNLAGVIRLLQSALQSNQMDMYVQGTGGLGGYAGQQTYLNMQRAGQLASSANTALVEAKRLSPHIPLTRTTKVKQSRTAIMSLFTDSLGSDLRQRYKLRSQFQDARAVYQEATIAKAWQERETNRIRQDLQAAQAAYVAAEDSLESERVRLIQVPIPA